METSDEALAQAAGRGDRAAFAALIDRHYERIHRLAWSLTGAPDRADDLAQDVAMALARRIRQFRGEAKFTTWLYQVVLNAARDAGRRAASRDRALSRYAEESDLRRGAEAARQDDAEWLRGALAALRDDWRETAALVVGEGLTQAEAAKTLGLAEGAIAWRMSEIRKALAAMARAESES